MHLCRFDKHHLGLVEGDSIFDVTEALSDRSRAPWPAPIGDPLVLNLPAIKDQVSRLRKTATARRLSEVSLYSPITAPSKIMAAPANYKLHVQIDAQDPGVHHGVHNKALEGVERPVEKYGLFL